MAITVTLEAWLASVCWSSDFVVGIARRPIQKAAGIRNGVVQQERVAFVAGPLHVAVIGDKAGHESDAQPVGQTRSSSSCYRPLPVGSLAVDADRDGRQAGGAGDLGRQRGELLGEGRIGGRVVLGAGADSAGTGRAVVIDFPAPVFLVADFPILDVGERGGMIDPQEIQAVVGAPAAMRPAGWPNSRPCPN